MPPVEIRFVLIPDSRHTDPILDECILGQRSCCADLLCEYEDALMKCGGEGEGGARDLGKIVVLHSKDDGERAINHPYHSIHAYPDAILPLVVPIEERPLVMRLCSIICPF
ncbi:unnamed protein product [Phytomonas sp. Hart1]|nr:unnamed protein product [Phytomonas sp. Hart1]|eukprot:CCW72034.1 unnamed protein product [Phytomonas sp. isolate Hart1]